MAKRTWAAGVPDQAWQELSALHQHYVAAHVAAEAAADAYENALETALNAAQDRYEAGSDEWQLGSAGAAYWEWIEVMSARLGLAYLFEADEDLVELVPREPAP
jgi:hypothetical protein